ncbi:hypothetical protein FF38_09364 [Lucilia cuprina]|uniref:Uncharacterized protein n=1 Tax=Lucilia cuprina TaxID=7375 RepID=A0A0L0CQZ8_LUCCU|nr:hypothetical protein FF38_09364 [Lucilia cuprina]
MSHLIGILLVLVSLAVTTCRALPDFHKQMSPQQLQSIFHVDSPDAVPHYEVIELLHHNTQEPASQPQYSHSNHYRRRRRSVEPLLQMQDLKQQQHQLRDSQHVKKDLSKNPYYSELKEKSTKSRTSINSILETTSSSSSAAKSDKEIKDIKEHKVSFNAFGKNLNLTLKQTEGLFKNGQVHRLPMWYVDNEMNATHGLNLQKIEDELNHTSDNVGQVFQDEENMAAILMRRHEVTGDLVMESKASPRGDSAKGKKVTN